MFMVMLYITANNFSIMSGQHQIKIIKYLAQDPNTDSAGDECQASNLSIPSVMFYQLSDCLPHSFKKNIVETQMTTH